MAHLHCRRRTRVYTRIRIPNLMATSESIPASVSGNVNEPEGAHDMDDKVNFK